MTDYLLILIVCSPEQVNEALLTSESNYFIIIIILIVCFLSNGQNSGFSVIDVPC